MLGIPLYGADPRPAAVRDEDRLPAAVRRRGRPPSARPGGHARRRRGGGRARRDARDSAPRCGTRSSSSTTASPGRGNATVDLAEPPGAGQRRRARRSSARRVEGMAFEQHDITLEGYLAQLASDGGIVEERVVGAELRSPSVQLRVTPLGEVELLSTHDQLLGGPSGQKYLGCRFPADFGYAQAITREAAKIGAALAQRGRPRPLRRRLRRRPRPRAARGRRTRSRSTCARAARRTRSSRSSSSPTAATTRRRRCSRRRAAARSTSSRRITSSRSSSAGSPSTTCSTSRSGTGSTSTRRARPASCST